MSIYKMKPTLNGEGGSSVVANPELVGDEPDLTGLEVEGTKYKVPEGTQQVQADWNQSNDQEPDYIKNKPSIPDAVSGTSSGDNWTSITIGNTTKNIPQGSSGDTKLYSVDVRLDMHAPESCDGSVMSFAFNTLDITDLPDDFEELVSYLAHNNSSQDLYILARLQDNDNIFNKDSYDGYVIITLAYTYSEYFLRITF